MLLYTRLFGITWMVSCQALSILANPALSTHVYMCTTGFLFVFVSSVDDRTRKHRQGAGLLEKSVRGALLGHALAA